MGRDVAEVRRAFAVLRNAGAVVGDRQVVLASLPAAGDGDVARARIDRVLDELGDRFQRVLLRQGDDGDRVPVVADAELSGRTDQCARSPAVRVARLFHRPILADAGEVGGVRAGGSAGGPPSRAKAFGNQPECPRQVHAMASSARTRPAFNRYELPRMSSATALGEDVVSFPTNSLRSVSRTRRG